MTYFLRPLYEYLEHSACTCRANSRVGVRTNMPGPFLFSLALGRENRLKYLSQIHGTFIQCFQNLQQ